MPQLDFDGANSKISADKIQGQSGTTVTIPAGHNLAGDGSGLTSLPAANLTGTVATARLGTGTADGTTFLRGDQTYAAAGGGDLNLLSTTNFSGSSSHVEISLDYSAHNSFLLVCSQIQGSSSSSENCDVHFKRSGQSSFDTGGTDYGFGGTFHDSNTAINVNGADAMEVFRGRVPDQFNMFVAQITGAGTTTTKTSFMVQYTQCDPAGGGTSAKTMNGTNFSNERIVAVRFSFTAGTVTTLKTNLYGYGQ